MIIRIRKQKRVRNVSLRRKRPDDYSGKTSRETLRGTQCPIIGLVEFYHEDTLLRSITAKKILREDCPEIWDWLKEYLSEFGVGTWCKLTMFNSYRKDGTERNVGRLRKAVGPLPMVRDYGIGCRVTTILNKDDVRTCKIDVHEPTDREIRRRHAEEQQTKNANERHVLRDPEMKELREAARKVRLKLKQERKSREH